jgi:hypothetical protein
MSIEEIEKLYLKLSEEYRKAGFMRLYPSADWQAAFDLYNEGHPDERPLHQGCKPCYIKVLRYMSDMINHWKKQQLNCFKNE